MPTHIYHWKHGWIPLDHAAALKKSKGSEAGARKALASSHATGHAHGSVVGGSYGGGTHVRGLQPVAAEHLPRAGHITAAFNPDSRRFALHDPQGGNRSSLSPTRTVDASDVKVGDVVHSPRLIGTGTQRLRIDKAFPAGPGGHVNVDATDLDTGRKHQIALEGFKQHHVERPTANGGSSTTTTSIPEHLAQHFHSRGHKVVAVRHTAHGEKVTVETRDGGLKLFAADGSDKHIVDPTVVEPPAQPKTSTPNVPRSAPTGAAANYHQTHNVKRGSMSNPDGSARYYVLTPTNGRGADVIDAKLGEHITNNNHKVIGFERRVVTTVDDQGVVRRFKADGSNIHKPVMPKAAKFTRKDVGNWQHTAPHEAIPNDGSVGDSISALKVKRAYVHGNKRVIIESSLTDAQTEAFLNSTQKAFDASGHSDIPITIHVKTGDRNWNKGTLAYVYRGDTTRVQVNPQVASGDFHPGNGDHFMPAGYEGDTAAYVLTHELGHIADFRGEHTVEGERLHGNKTSEQHFHHEHRSQGTWSGYGGDRRGLSRYGGKSSQEGYAEAFAEYHLNPRTNNATVLAYAKRYGW